MATDPISLDLDAITPEQGQVTLNGEVYKVNQPSLEDLVFLTKTVNVVNKQNPEVVLNALDELNKYLPKLLPDYSGSLTLQQAMSFITFMFQLSAPPEAQLNAEKGISPTAEKKTTDTVN